MPIDNLRENFWVDEENAKKHKKARIIKSKLMEIHKILSSLKTKNKIDTIFESFDSIS